MKKQHILSLLFLVAALLATVPGAKALDTAHYAPTSVLAQGRWMKVRVPADGLYRIPTATLRAWGFADPSRVRVFGYGGRREAELLNAANYIDDLPLTPSELTPSGLVFYGRGPLQWVQSTSGRFHAEPNVYSAYGYYFVGELPEGMEDPGMASSGTPVADDSAARTFMARLHHEQEGTLAWNAGPLLVGEDFRFTKSRTFAFDLADALAGGAAWLESSFVANISASASLTVSAGGKTLGTTTVPAKSSSTYSHGNETISRHTFTVDAPGRTEIGISFAPSSGVSSANLNYISLNYERTLSLPAAGVLEFDIAAKAVALDGVLADTRIWDVSSAPDVKTVDFALEGNTACWAPDRASMHSFVAWNPSAALPAPTPVGIVANQNLHGTDGAELIIVADAEYAEAAERLAAFHRTDATPLSAMVVEPGKIYNEFGSGATGVTALRKYLKMLYDRGNAGQGTPLRYVILMGRTTIDNRALTPGAPSYPTIPAWMPAAPSASLNDNLGYCNDDYMVMLADGSGTDMARDKLSVPLGRIPVTDIDEALSVVDKTIQYARSARKTAWKQRFLFLADDGNEGKHLKQTESMIDAFATSDRQQHLVRKVYVDNYTLDGNTATVARETMYRYLDEGVVWWNFIGHANKTSWTSEGMLTYTDINNMYLRHWPFIYAATCDFLRYDGSEISGAELLYKERYGGAIGVISAVRPVYIDLSKHFSNAMGRALTVRDENGLLPTPGQIYMAAKNDVRNDQGQPIADENRMRYCFVGDPALRLATPSNIVRLDRIKDTPVASGEQITIAAWEKATVEGSVTDPAGNILSDFDGVVMVEIFDAERSFTTQGHGSDGTEDTFEDYGERVYCGSADVRGGRFTLTVAMPGELSQNFRPATMSLFAYATNSNDEAIGLDRGFYVYGYDENAAPDTEAPTIEGMVLNHSTFRNGDTVNTSPMLIATVHDNTGINVSNAGVGRQMTATLDGTEVHSDVAFYYTPLPDGTPGGVINYPFESIQPGAHTLRLRVWDTMGNSATSDISFNVAADAAPKIFEVYSDANPAVDQANFYLSHNQPEVMATVEISVYDLMGRKLWSRATTGRSDMFLTVPVQWDLCDSGGRRVPRGIYLYRATISTDGGKSYQTASRRIAVAAQ